MQSITSCFSVSPALIRENLRRFWAVPVFGFLGYFFSGVFPLLMSDGSSWYYMLRSTLQFRNPGFVFFGCLFPLIAAVLLQRYLYAPGSVAVMHALPFTRAKLFNSNFISGLLLVWLPIVAVGLICLLLKKPDLAAVFPNPGEAPAQISAASYILSRFALMLLSTLFVYTVCVLAGMVTGNTPMHLIVCGLLNGIVPAVILFGYAYCTRFLFGFSDSGEFLNFVASLSPAIYFPLTGGAPGAAVVAAYIVAAVVLCAFASVLYARRPLEKAGDSTVFTFMEIVFCCFAALAGMTALAYYFEILYSQGNYSSAADGGAADLYFCIGMVVGAVVAFALARIIVKRTPRIWNRETALQFGAFALVALLLFVGLRLDLYGYERRVPAAAGVESVAISVPSRNYNAIVRPESSGNTYTFRDASNIEAVTVFHSRVAENRDAFRQSSLSTANSNLYMRLRYALPRGASMSRTWALPADFLSADASLRALVESEEFRAQNSLSNPAIKRITEIALTEGVSGLDLRLSSDEFDGFAAAVNADLRRCTYEQLFDLRYPLATLQISYLDEKDRPEEQLYRSLWLSIPADAENTVAWLRDRGYYDRFTAWRADVRSIRLTHVGAGFEFEEEEIAVIRDPALIRAALEQMETDRRDWGEEYWMLEFSTSADGGASGGEAADLPQAEFYDSGPYNRQHSFYLNPGNPALDMLLEAVGRE
jgi:ABC-2 type transport system permease protein